MARFVLSAIISLIALGQASADNVVADLSGHKPESGIAVRQDDARLRIAWPIDKSQYGVLILQLQANEPLIEELGVAQAVDGPVRPLLRKTSPVTFLTVGVRDTSKQGWNIFFDNPPKKPHETFRATLALSKVRVESQGRRSTVILDRLDAGSFTGDMRFTFYAGCPLLHAEAVLSTRKDNCAILYDAGLTCKSPDAKNVAWHDTNDQFQRVHLDIQKPAEPVAVRHRTILMEGANGSVALFPPPHQYLYPLDFADNFKLTWFGRGFHKHDEWGVGVRQPPEGDGRYVPWINAPPGTKQHLSVFYLVSPAKAEAALDEVRKFTHGDRFKKLDGYLTFTSHYHQEHTLDFLRKQRKEKTDKVPQGLEEPPFVKTFKSLGVDVVHLAEFHTQHTPEFILERLPQLKTMHQECRRLSGDTFLLLPGEEPNVHLGGHWIILFPRPVYWIIHPRPGTPFEQKVTGLGTVYAIHNIADLLRMLEKEGGLIWTVHPRIKTSFGFPDRYRDQGFYLSDRFLGAAWKAMPADLSRRRLGTRVLDLMDDMANWGQHKYVLGEVDVFKVRPDSELYGHMNINYIRVAKLPRFDDGWQPILDALQQGRFFVSTGEVLMPEFKVGGKESGQTLELGANTMTEVTARVEWTFPLAFAEVIWGDGKLVHRKQVDLTDSEAFSSKLLRIPVDLKGAKWVRFEIWDIAVNGAFSQPVWIK